jgi:hypothetical protein
MGVDNVVADAHVNGNGDAKFVTGCEDADVAVGIIAGGDFASDGFAKSQAIIGSGGYNVIESSRFAPQAELSGTDVFGDGFAGRSDSCQFVIVNDPGPIHRDDIDKPATHQVDDVSAKPVLDNVSAHHQHDGSTPASGLHNPLCQCAKVFVLERFVCLTWFQEARNIHEVFPLSQGLECQARLIEGFVSACHDYTVYFIAQMERKVQPPSVKESAGMQGMQGIRLFSSFIKSVSRASLLILLFVPIVSNMRSLLVKPDS